MSYTSTSGVTDLLLFLSSSVPLRMIWKECDLARRSQRRTLAGTLGIGSLPVLGRGSFGKPVLVSLARVLLIDAPFPVGRGSPFPEDFEVDLADAVDDGFGVVAADT
jgi:hypothetical protein